MPCPIHPSPGPLRFPCWLWLLAGLLAAGGCDTLPGAPPAASEPHSQHEHHDEQLLELSGQARATIGLVTGPVRLETYTETITVPGKVVERPGRSKQKVPAPLAGVVTSIFRTPGETVTAGEPLFELHLMHEELVAAQGEYLRLVADEKVAQAEIERLQEVAREGIVAGRQLLDRQYQLQKIQAQLNAQRERLLLHGLTGEHLNFIARKKKLVHGVTVFAPGGPDSHRHPAGGDQPQAAGGEAETSSGPRLEMQRLLVEQGQHVEAGQPLCVLVDYSQLFIEGQAFQPDVPHLLEIIAQGRTVSATIGAGGDRGFLERNLRLEYVDNTVDHESRLHAFYVQLPNQTVRGAGAEPGGRFVQWKYRPGQRVKLQIPVRQWKDRIVLPAAAVAQDGLEAYVFLENGSLFERRAVRVDIRDSRQQLIVIANDGSLYPGDVIALNNADLLNLELKTRGHTTADPHHGHAH
ncbi:MAG: secretion protein HlyD [Planctomycetales bacterium]|nr:secretion protein HlyD [Planctomycetales bacterium]